MAPPPLALFPCTSCTTAVSAPIALQHNTTKGGGMLKSSEQLFGGCLDATAAAHTSQADWVRHVPGQARAAQHTAQLSGLDVPMLEDLLPLSELHDPFLETDWHHELEVQQQQPPQQQQGNASGVAGAQHSSSPTQLQAFFAGIPAYGEPDSPAAGLLNNAAGFGMVFGLGEGLAAVTAVGGQPLAGPDLANVVVALGAHQPAVPDTSFLLPAIAAAQQRAVALATTQQRAAARMQVENTTSGGNSHVSNASNASTVAATQSPPPLGAAVPRSDDSCGGHIGEEHLKGVLGTPSHSAAPSQPAPSITTIRQPSLIFFTAGKDSKQPTRRGGRPREKKSYDALIDPNLPIEEVRRLRRMLSNRESARRSRRRRHTQVTSLESELEALKADNSWLESELTRTSAVAQQLAAEKQALLAEVERLRGQLAHMSTSSGTLPAVPLPIPAPEAIQAAVEGPASGLPPLIEQAQRMAAAKLAMLHVQGGAA